MMSVGVRFELQKVSRLPNLLLSGVENHRNSSFLNVDYLACFTFVLAIENADQVARLEVLDDHVQVNFKLLPGQGRNPQGLKENFVVLHTDDSSFEPVQVAPDHGNLITLCINGRSSFLNSFLNHLNHTVVLVLVFSSLLDGLVKALQLIVVGLDLVVRVDLLVGERFHQEALVKVLAAVGLHSHLEVLNVSVR